jgi:hypothetical protein
MKINRRDIIDDHMRGIGRGKLMALSTAKVSISTKTKQKDLVPYNNLPNEILSFEILAGGKVPPDRVSEKKNERKVPKYLLV